MVLPTSGQLSFGEINIEIGRGFTSQIGLLQAESGQYVAINQASTSRPNGSSPYGINEWYGYNHSATAGATITNVEFSSDETNPYMSTIYVSGVAGYLNQNSIQFEYTRDGGTTTSSLQYLYSNGTNAGIVYPYFYGFTRQNSYAIRARTYSGGTYGPWGPYFYFTVPCVPYGAIYAQYCNGCNMMQSYHDGNCGYTGYTDTGYSYYCCPPPASFSLSVGSGTATASISFGQTMNLEYIEVTLYGQTGIGSWDIIGFSNVGYYYPGTFMTASASGYAAYGYCGSPTGENSQYFAYGAAYANGLAWSDGPVYC
jgi:hypothetical protein